MKWFFLFILIFSCSTPKRFPAGQLHDPLSCADNVGPFFNTNLWNHKKITTELARRLENQEFNDQAWYDLLNADPYALKKFLQEKVRDEKYLNRIEYELGKDYLVLLLHPGLFSRFDHFLSFAKSVIGNLPDKISSATLYQMYSQHLGPAKIFRGMALENDQVANNLATKGIPANFLGQNTHHGTEVLSQEITQALPNKITPYILEVQQHIRGGAENSRYLSVSHYLEVAGSVGFYRNPRIGPPIGKRLYLFELEMPKIELIEFSDYYKDVTKAQSGYFTINDKKYLFSDLQVEYLISFFIKKEWIKKVHRYENPPPPWRYFR